ncbi:MAG: anti-sigma factor [Gammaproteobacteria bacterium]|nr:anti-sigma factor [Gammaproteobacteria bacterium]MDH5803149.1 anti-sigma factor [Gammaproteobacteria bacterium]
MSEQLRPVSEEDLHAFLDGQLDSERQAQVVRWLEDNPQEKIRLQQLRQLNQLLQLRHREQLVQPIPSSMELDFNPGVGQKPLLIAASVTWLLIGLVVGWLWHGDLLSEEGLQVNLVRPAMVAHATYIPEVVHPVEVAAEQEAHLIKWLSKRLGVTVHAADLTSLGFNLVGGRLLPAGTDPAAQFMYENNLGRRLTLYVRVKTEAVVDTSFRFAQDQGISTFYWIDGNLGYALSGELTREHLLQVANLIYRQWEP